MQNKYLNIIIIFVAAFILGAGSSYVTIPRPSVLPPLLPGSENNQSASVMLDYGNDTFDIVSLSIPKTDSTLFELLKKADEDKKISFGYKDYGGSLGVFIQSINGVEGSGETYWQYWVNNAYAQVGVSSYRVNPGDIIMFKLTKSQMQ